MDLESNSFSATESKRLAEIYADRINPSVRSELLTKFILPDIFGRIGRIDSSFFPDLKTSNDALVLDIGCGKGAVGAALRALKILPERAQIYGLDFFPYPSPYKTNYQEVFQGDATDPRCWEQIKNELPGGFNLIISVGMPPPTVAHLLKTKIFFPAIGKNGRVIFALDSNPGKPPKDFEVIGGKYPTDQIIIYYRRN